jgi:hypothetical protein
MSNEITVALIGLLGIIIGAIPTYFFMRQKNLAEIEKIKAETEKIKAEAAKINAELTGTNKIRILNSVEKTSGVNLGINAKKIKILFVATNPPSSFHLDYETNNILNILKPPIFELISASSPTVDELRRLVLLHKPNILHISSHGDKSKKVDKNLSTLLSIYRESICLLFMNSFYSAEICKDLAKIIDFTIGIEGKITDAQTINFSEAFYQGLGSGLDIQTSFDIAHVGGGIPEGAYQLFSFKKNPKKKTFIDSRKK